MTTDDFVRIFDRQTKRLDLNLIDYIGTVIEDISTQL